MVDKGLLCIARQPFHLNGSESISRTENKRPNMTKDASIALTDQEIPRIQGAVGQELWMEDVFINHNITVLMTMELQYYP